ncbi:MAG: HU family DNA-binding protein [Treponema sp.]|nr:HU family DNA-binding protein [Treponema sp.]
MALWLKKIQRRNPLSETQEKWYLTQEKSGSVGMKDISREIEGRSALSPGDVQSVLSNLVEVLPVFLKLGQTVNLEGFGTFRISVSSEGAATAKELNARYVKGVKMLFLPSPELKRSLEDITFEIPAETPETPETPTT